MIFSNFSFETLIIKIIRNHIGKIEGGDVSIIQLLTTSNFTKHEISLFLKKFYVYT